MHGKPDDLISKSNPRPNYAFVVQPCAVLPELPVPSVGCEVLPELPVPSVDCCVSSRFDGRYAALNGGRLSMVDAAFVGTGGRSGHGFTTWKLAMKLSTCVTLALASKISDASSPTWCNTASNGWRKMSPGFLTICCLACAIILFCSSSSPANLW